jgi:sugar phosphate isomerase/epimerase
MNLKIARRSFLTKSLGIASLSAASLVRGAVVLQDRVVRTPGIRLKIGLNAYSFDAQLRSGATTLVKLIDFCAQNGLDSLDATGYYFPGYPEVPSDETLYNFKRRAYLNGIAISFVGVKNDFTLPDAAAREKQVQLVKDWTIAAVKLGAPMLRVFTGPNREVPGYTYDQVVKWMIPNFRECAEFGEKHGVVMALQNHEDFIRTAGEVIDIIQAVNSDWFSSILDVGSLRKFEVYEEIEKLLPYAVSWLIKENVWYGEKAVPIDLGKVKNIIDRGGYRGYLPILTLGEGDPAQKVMKLANEMRRVFNEI